MFRSLEITDIPPLKDHHHASAQVDALRMQLQRHAASSSRFPLLRAIISTFRTRVVLAHTLVLIYVHTGIFSFLIFRALGEYFTQCFDTRNDLVRGGASFGTGVGLISAAALAYFVTMLLRAHALYQMEIVGGQVRTLLGCMMFEKSFVIAPSAKRRSVEQRSEEKLGTTSGEQDPQGNTSKDKLSGEQSWSRGAVLSSMATDTERIEAVLAVSTDVTAFPALLPALLGMGWILLNWPGLVSSCFMISLTPVVLFMISTLTNVRRGINRLTDRRVDLVNDMLQGVRFLKYILRYQVNSWLTLDRIFAWEDIFLARVSPIRQEEIRKSIRSQFIMAGTWMGVVAQQRSAALLSVGLYTFYGSTTNAVGIIPYTLVLWIAGDASIRLVSAAPTVANSISAFQNIEDYLLAEEQIAGQDFVWQCAEGNAIELRAAAFQWNTTQEFTSSPPHEPTIQLFKLHPVTLEIHKGELIAIVGPVGCGKSSLAAALAGEMTHVDGEVHRSDKKIAYHCQISWIQNASVRENIIFGQPYDEARYLSIVSACALDRDIRDEFPAGHETELGERGITISGGQKARIQLARTLYRQLTTILLDDPLSAVDAHTATQVFDNVICGELLQNSTRILITHQLHVLPRCDRVVWMDNGSIRGVDTYDNLVRDEPDFAHFVGAALREEKYLEDEASGTATPASEMQTEPSVGERKHDGYDNKESMKNQAKTTDVDLGQKDVENLMVRESCETESIPWRLYWSFLGYASRQYVPALVLACLMLCASNTLYVLSFGFWTSRKWALTDLKYAMIVLGMFSLYFICWVSRLCTCTCGWADVVLDRQSTI